MEEEKKAPTFTAFSGVRTELTDLSDSVLQIRKDISQLKSRSRYSDSLIDKANPRIDMLISKIQALEEKIDKIAKVVVMIVIFVLGVPTLKYILTFF